MSTSQTEQITSFALSKRLYEAGIKAPTPHFYVISSTAAPCTAPEPLTFAGPQTISGQNGVCFIPAYDEATLARLLVKSVPDAAWLFEVLDKQMDIRIEHFWDVFSYRQAFTLEVIGELVLESHHADPKL